VRLIAAWIRERQLRRLLRLSNVRLLSQAFFFAAFVLSVWATWTTRLQGYPVSRLLEIDLLVFVSTALSTGFVYRFLGWAVVVLILTLLFGRVFCNWICPFGTLHQAVGWLFCVRKPSERWRRNQYRSAYRHKYALVLVLLVLAGLGALQIGLVDPLSLLYRSVVTAIAPAVDWLAKTIAGAFPSLNGVADDLIFAPGAEQRVFVGSFWIGALFVVLVGMNLVIPRFFCRVLCPLGALLGACSRFAVFRINRAVGRCTDCNLCLTRCEGACNPHSQLRLSECFACMNCLDDCPEDALSFTMMHRDRQQVIPEPDLGRRRVFFALVTGLLAYPLLKHNGATTITKVSPQLVRPPGSLEEEEFLQRCIKCEQCLDVCPTNVLQPASLEQAGVEGLWSPVLDFNLGFCQLKCSLCSEVCPTGAIRTISVAEKLGAASFAQAGPIRLGTAFFDLGRCLPHAMEIPCVVCEEVCPTSPKAIQTSDVETHTVFGERITLRKPFMVPDLCIGCGICQYSCPVTDQRAVRVSPMGESRSPQRQLLLDRRIIPARRKPV